MSIQDSQALIVTRARTTADRLCKGSIDPTIGARDDVGRVQDPVLQVAACPTGGPPTQLPDDLHDHTRIPSDTDDLQLVITAKAATGLRCSTGTITPSAGIAGQWEILVREGRSALMGFWGAALY